MKILILANNAGGLYGFRKELMQALLKQGNQVFASIPDEAEVPQVEKLGVKVIKTAIDRRGINPITDLKLLWDYLRLIITVKPDLVITYTIKPNVYGGLVCRLLNKRYAINITGLGTAFQTDNFVKKLVCFLYKVSCKKAKTVFFENEGNKQIFIDSGLIKSTQAYRLNGAGVNLAQYEFTPYPAEDAKLRFLFVGRIMKEKGIDELLQATRNIKKKYPEIQFDIVGPMEDNYQDVIEQATKDGLINYFGFQSDVKPFIKQASCFVLPSYHEGMANTLLENAAMGRPLITSRIHGCLEAVEEGKNGYLVPVKDASALEEAIEKFVDLSYAEKKAMGQASRQHMVEVFDKDLVVRQTISELMKG